MKNRVLGALSAAVAAVLTAFPSFATGYTWSSSVAEGSWSDPASWGESGYPMESSDTAKFSSATAVVNLDVAPSIASATDTFINSDVKFVGGKTLKISGGSWKIMKAAKIEASGAGTKVWFSGDGCKYIYGSGNLLRASDGGCIEVRGFKPGTEMWDITSNLPSNMSIEADGEDSLIILRMDNNTAGIAGSGFTFKATNGGEIQYGMGRSESKFCKDADFLSKDASVVLDDGSFVMGYTGFSMSTENSGQSIELKGALPLLKTATFLTIGNSTADVTLKFMPEAAWAYEVAARVQSGSTATLGAHTVLVVDGSAFGAVAGTKIIPLVSGKTELALADGVIAGAAVTGFPSGVTASLVTNADDNSLPPNTLYLKLVSNVRAVEVPTVEGVTYDGQAHAPVVAASTDYTITTLPQDVVDAGEYDVVLTLNAAGTAWADDGTTDPKTLKFVISKAANSWTTEPSLSKTTWEYLDPAATVTVGEAMTGEAATVLYDGFTDVMPENVGTHTAVFTVAESKNYTGLSKTISYTVKPRTNTWVTEPSITPTSWVFDEPAGEVSLGEAESGGEVVVTYDDGLTEMPTGLGTHKAVFTVAASENYTSLKKELSFEITKKVNGWTSAPVVEPTRYTPGSLPTFTPPTATYGDVVRYFDGDPANTEVPTSMGKHTVTYAVAEGDDYQAFEQTIELTVLDKATLGVAQVVITGYDGSETLTNFPALVRFSADNVEGLNADLLSEDGSDVRVYGEDGNELAFEIESWDRTGESIIWVKIPELAPTSEKTTSVFVKWGATDERTTEPKDVWAEYLAVWHMNDTVTLGEAAGNGSDLTGATRTLEDGVVGKAIKHSADMKMSDFVHCEGGIGEDYTISCWYKLPNGGDGAILNKGSWVDNGRWYTQYKSSTTTMGLIRDKGVKASLTTKDCKTEWNYSAVINNGGTMYAVVNGSSSLTSFGKLALADDYAFTVSRSNALVDELRIRKRASSAVWTRAECRAQSGEFAVCALVQNPQPEDVIVLPAETAPVVDSERTLTIGYRVTSTGGSTVTVKALYAMEGADAPNETVIGSTVVAQTEDAFGTIEDLMPGTNYLVAVYGVNASGVASEPTAWQQVAVPGPVMIEDLEFSQTKDKVTITGVVAGLGVKTAKLRYAFGADEFAQIDLVLGDDGAFSVTLDRVSATDALKYQVVAQNTLETTTWGNFAWNAETEVKTSTDSTAVTYTWKGGASGEWADPANWEASVPSSYGFPNNETHATAKFVSDAEVDLGDGSYSVKEITFANKAKAKLSNGKFKHDSKTFNSGHLELENVSFTITTWPTFANGHTIVLEGSSSFNCYRVWNSTGGTLLVRNGEPTIDGVAGYCGSAESKDNNLFMISNAVLTVKGTSNNNSAGGRPLVIRNGADRQGRLLMTSSTGASLNYYRYDFAVPANGLRQPAIEFTKMTGFESLIANTKPAKTPRITVDVTQFERGKKVPLVRYGTTSMAELPTPELTTVPAEAKAERNARLYWEDNTLWYKQDGKFGFAVIVK